MNSLKLRARKETLRIFHKIEHDRISKDFGVDFTGCRRIYGWEIREHDLYLIKIQLVKIFLRDVKKFFAEANKSGKIGIIVYRKVFTDDRYVIIPTLLAHRLRDLKNVQFAGAAHDHVNNMIGRFEELRKQNHQDKVCVLFVCGEFALMDYTDFIIIMKHNKYV